MYVLQVAACMYSCLALALGLLTAFCPEVHPQEAAQGLGLGWPQAMTLCLVQRQCIALTHSMVSLPYTNRTTALARDIKCCLLLTAQLLHRMHVHVDERQRKDVAATQHEIQRFLQKP